jgi:phage repressor protein C with HTH and peptisase S24 domain
MLTNSARENNSAVSQTRFQNVGMTLGERIKERREAIKLSQDTLGKAVGVSRSAVAQWESDLNAPTLDKIPGLALALGVSAEWLLTGVGVVTGSIEPIRLGGRTVDLGESLRVPSVASMPVDLPEIGVAAGGNNGDFSINGQTVDYKRRPPGLMSNRSAFAIRVIGDSMYPRYEEGELIYIDPKRPPRIGDDILVELKPERGGEPGHAYIKRLLAKTPTKLRVGQFNPPKENIEIPLDGVLRISTVLQLADLLGV